MCKRRKWEYVYTKKQSKYADTFRIERVAVSTTNLQMWIFFLKKTIVHMYVVHSAYNLLLFIDYLRYSLSGNGKSAPRWEIRVWQVEGIIFHYYSSAPTYASYFKFDSVLSILENWTVSWGECYEVCCRDVAGKMEKERDNKRERDGDWVCLSRWIVN